MNNMSVNVNIHRPEVQQGELGVHRRLSGPPDELVISLASGQYPTAVVVLFTNDAGWDAIVDAVDAFRASSEERITELDVVDNLPMTWHACQSCGGDYTLLASEHNSELCQDCWEERHWDSALIQFAKDQDQEGTR